VQKAISILLLLVLQMPMLLKIGIVVNWKLNQTTITKTFCVNKDKPNMHCNGKCHLKKQLAKVEVSSTSETEKPFPTDKFKKIELSEFVICGNVANTIIIFANVPMKNKKGIIVNNYTHTYFQYCLRPPIA
jgi:hypothetical protein